MEQQQGGQLPAKRPRHDSHTAGPAHGTCGSSGSGGAGAGAPAQEAAGPSSEPDLAAAEQRVLWTMVAEAGLFALASHAYWGVWSFIQARYSPIEFDYLEYSSMRWREYYKRKPEAVQRVQQCYGLEWGGSSSSGGVGVVPQDR